MRKEPVYPQCVCCVLEVAWGPVLEVHSRWYPGMGTTHRTTTLGERVTWNPAGPFFGVVQRLDKRGVCPGYGAL